MDLWSLQNNGGGGALASPAPNRKLCMSFKGLAGLRGRVVELVPGLAAASLGCPG